MVVDRTSHFQLRLDQCVLAEHNIDEDRTVPLKQFRRDLIDIFDLGITYAIRGRDASKIGQAEAVAGGGVAAVAVAVLKLLDDAVTCVVHDDYGDCKIVVLERLQFVDIQVEAAVAGYRDDLALGAANFAPMAAGKAYPIGELPPAVNSLWRFTLNA